PAGLGLSGVDHPLLGATIRPAGRKDLLCTGRLSLPAQPWLAGHALRGTVLVPGAAFVELAGHAGELAGCDLVEELTLETPLVLGEHDDVQLHVVLEGPDAQGRRRIGIHSRPG